MSSQLITIQHLNTVRTFENGDLGISKDGQTQVVMLTIDGNEDRKAYRVSPEIEDQALTELYQNPPRLEALTIEVEDDLVVNYYR